MSVFMYSVIMCLEHFKRNRPIRYREIAQCTVAFAERNGKICKAAAADGAQSLGEYPPFFSLVYARSRVSIERLLGWLVSEKRAN